MEKKLTLDILDEKPIKILSWGGIYSEKLIRATSSFNCDLLFSIGKNPPTCLHTDDALFHDTRFLLFKTLTSIS